MLGVGTSPKTSIDIANGYLIGIQYLAPADLSGNEVCTHRSDGCTTACYNSAGRGAMRVVQDARVRKTRLFFDRRAEYLKQLEHDIALLETKAAQIGLRPAVRLNGTSDIVWERKTPELFTLFSHINFYDYTKIPHRVGNWIDGNLPSNYHLTFSRSEHNDADARDLLARGAGKRDTSGFVIHL